MAGGGVWGRVVRVGGRGAGGSRGLGFGRGEGVTDIRSEVGLGIIGLITN